MSIDPITSNAPAQAVRLPDSVQRTEPKSPSQGFLHVSGTQPGTPEPGLDDLSEAVTKLNETAKALGRTLEFEVIKDRITVKVIDTKSQEVLMEIPPRRLVEALRRMDETFGLLLDRKL